VQQKTRALVITFSMPCLFLLFIVGDSTS